MADQCESPPSASEGENIDQAILSQQRDIEKEIAEKQTYLISNPEDFSSLAEEYTQDEEFLKRIEELKAKYKCMRRTRADGNCFYRAFGFSLFESLRKDEESYKKFREDAKAAKELLTALGYEEFTVTDFYDNFLDELEKVCTDKDFSTPQLEDLFNDSGMSNYLVVFLRLMTSACLQRDEEFYINFIESSPSIKDFCSQEVEPMDKESDHVQIMALTSASNICVEIFCMERGQHTTLTFPNDQKPVIHLLYRPGHYDILYPKSESS